LAEEYTFRDFRLDANERRLTRGGEAVHMEPRSFALLHYFLQRPGKLVTKQELIDSVWRRAVVSDNALTRCVHQIRTALGDYADDPEFIETVPGYGYRFIAPVVRATAARERSSEIGTPRSRLSYQMSVALLVIAVSVTLVWVGIEETNIAPAPIERLAVLPLVNLTGDENQHYLVQGIHESLIAELSRAEAIDVISRTSVMRYRGSDLAVPEIALDLDVDAIVEGSVMREGEELYITAQLIAAAPERHLWAQRFHRSIADMFEIAPEVASSIAAEIGIDLETEDTLLATRRTFSPQAYNDFLLARFHYERKTPSDYQRAQQLFRRATEIDPQFASAYASLAHTYGSAAVWGFQDPAIAMPMARSLAERAIELDATLADADLILAGVRFYWDWNVARAQSSLQRVLEQNPSSAHAYRLLAEIMAVTGRHQEAFAAIERARELDPLSPTAQIKPAFHRYLSRDYEKAIEVVRAGLEFYPEFWQGHWVECLSRSAIGQHGEAIAACKAAVEHSRGASVALGALGYVYARGGKTDEAERIAAELVARRATRYVGAANLAIIYGALGHLDLAFEELERAYEGRDWLLVHVNNEGIFDSLREDERFHALQVSYQPALKVTP
jgi:DNA-binding winged helix-turn-helix (wHTH) protein/TolB-like protein/Flp pilus assembly protein TadD